MPDWMSHVLFGLILSELLNVKKKSLVLVGTIMPDVFFKLAVLMKLLGLDSSGLYNALFPLHTPIGCVLLSLIIASAIRSQRTSSFRLLSLGWASHFFLDMFQNYESFGETVLFFPFSWKSYSFQVMDSNEYPAVLIVMALIYVLLIVCRKKSQGQVRKDH